MNYGKEEIFSKCSLKVLLFVLNKSGLKYWSGMCKPVYYQQKVQQNQVSLSYLPSPFTVISKI